MLFNEMTELTTSSIMKSRYVSVMVPLSTGQSRHIVVQSTPYEEAICDGCRKNGSIVMTNGEKCIVVECPDCALDSWFQNSYGYKIDCDITIDELIKNEPKYSLSPSNWLSSYTDGTLKTVILEREHNEEQITTAMEYLIENVSSTHRHTVGEKDSCLENTVSEADDDRISTPTLSSLSITSPKVISRARRRLDLTRRMESLSLGEPAIIKKQRQE